MSADKQLKTMNFFDCSKQEWDEFQEYLNGTLPFKPSKKIHGFFRYQGNMYFIKDFDPARFEDYSEACFSKEKYLYSSNYAKELLKMFDNFIMPIECFQEYHCLGKVKNTKRIIFYIITYEKIYLFDMDNEQQYCISNYGFKNLLKDYTSPSDEYRLLDIYNLEMKENQIVFKLRLISNKESKCETDYYHLKINTNDIERKIVWNSETIKPCKLGVF